MADSRFDDAHITELMPLIVEHEREVFADTIAEWRAETLADPVIGGAHNEAAMRRIRALSYVGWPSPKDQADFTRLYEITGLGNNPTWLRGLHRIALLLKL